jgi:regulator of CtrA degradation
MGERSSVGGFGRTGEVTVSFGERFFGSDRFQVIYREGMELVEATARYLDGEGRREAKSLAGAVSVTFATESMRLTTRLMNLASWLLIRRSINTGEMTSERARKERLKLRLETIGRPSHIRDFDQLPARLRELIESSFALHDKISRLDRMFDVRSLADLPAPEAGANGVERQVQRLRLVYDRDAG